MTGRWMASRLIATKSLCEILPQEPVVVYLWVDLATIHGIQKQGTLLWEAPVGSPRDFFLQDLTWVTLPKRLIYWIDIVNFWWVLLWWVRSKPSLSREMLHKDSAGPLLPTHIVTYLPTYLPTNLPTYLLIHLSCGLWPLSYHLS